MISHRGANDVVSQISLGPLNAKEVVYLRAYTLTAYTKKGCSNAGVLPSQPSAAIPRFCYFSIIYHVVQFISTTHSTSFKLQSVTLIRDRDSLELEAPSLSKFNPVI